MVLLLANTVDRNNEASEISFQLRNISSDDMLHTLLMLRSLLYNAICVHIVMYPIVLMKRILSNGIFNLLEVVMHFVERTSCKTYN